MLIILKFSIYPTNSHPERS